MDKKRLMPEETSRRSRRWMLLSLIPIIGILMLFLAREALGLPRMVNTAPRTAQVLEWLRNGGVQAEWRVQALERCGSAPFSMPTSGFIGFIWEDSFYPGHRHQGLDIFGGEASGQTPVYAVYSGYLTRLDTWKSSLIIRIEADPLQPDRQIWTYYTHLADAQGSQSYISPDFPPGTEDIFVEAGTFLGYQGNYSGDPGNPVGVHLHFSIVKDDGQGKFLNELEIENTLDPSPYFGLRLDASSNPDQVPVCPPEQRTPAP
jgi:murein DD-endopeptidase MepM/ murein hydrolase activator NlpD